MLEIEYDILSEGYDVVSLKAVSAVTTPKLAEPLVGPRASASIVSGTETVPALSDQRRRDGHESDGAVIDRRIRVHGPARQAADHVDDRGVGRIGRAHHRKTGGHGHHGAVEKSAGREGTLKAFAEPPLAGESCRGKMGSIGRAIARI